MPELHFEKLPAAGAKGVPLLSPERREGGVIYHLPCLEPKNDPLDGFRIESSAEPGSDLRLASWAISQQAKGSIKALAVDVGARQFLYLGIGKCLPGVETILFDNGSSQAECEETIQEDTGALPLPFIGLDRGYGLHK